MLFRSLLNAVAASGVAASEQGALFDTVTLCLSKGLGAPVGSILAGPTDTIAQGRLYRKRLGGGMRQAGVLAAAGLIALEESPARLEEDHKNARFLAGRLAQVPGIRIDPGTVRTNIVIFDLSAAGATAAELSRELETHGILANGVGEKRMRIVTHLDVSRADCERAADVLAELMTRKMAVGASV